MSLATESRADPRAAYHHARTPAVYLHIPFCRSICPYCDFNTYARKGYLIDRYVDAMLTALATWPGRLAAAGRQSTTPVPSVYFGGGTPSLLGPEHLRRLIAAARAIGPLDKSTEVTLEANPGTVDFDYFAAARRAGVNRLSLGAQSFQTRGLKVLGRGHGAGGTERAVAAARAAGIDNLSLDLMFGWPEQTLAEWADDLDRALALAPDHFSLYSLQIEPNTPFGRLAQQGKLIAADEDLLADMYDLAESRLGEAGFRHYEISSWAKASPQRDVRSRHNLIYWQNAEYVAVGAGAHGFALGQRWVDTRRIETYISRLANGESAAEDLETIAFDRELSDTLIMGLRLDTGVQWDAIKTRFNLDPRDRYQSEIADLANAGLLIADTDGMRLTVQGWFIANEVFVRFLNHTL